LLMRRWVPLGDLSLGLGWFRQPTRLLFWMLNVFIFPLLQERGEGPH
jgi:hypothetical protein